MTIMLVALSQGVTGELRSTAKPRDYLFSSERQLVVAHTISGEPLLMPRYLVKEG